jgi:hypothetical protein
MAHASVALYSSQLQSETDLIRELELETATIDDDDHRPATEAARRRLLRTLRLYEARRRRMEDLVAEAKKALEDLEREPQLKYCAELEEKLPLLVTLSGPRHWSKLEGDSK